MRAAPVQLRYQTGLTSEPYVSCQAWRDATLERCPLHPSGGCRFARHGTYERVEPAGTRIARWYCREGHCTFSLLPDHLAARFPGTLQRLEDVVAEAESSASLEKTADRLRSEDVSLASAVRWLQRRRELIHQVLSLLLGLLPDQLAGCEPTVISFRARLATDAVLVRLRANAALPLSALPRPLGFDPGRTAAGGPKRRFQQPMGAGPPGGGE
jgi:hypothetical protein